MIDYHEIPGAFPDDAREEYPVVSDVCECGHLIDGEHDSEGICQIRGCDCEREQT